MQDVCCQILPELVCSSTAELAKEMVPLGIPRHPQWRPKLLDDHLIQERVLVFDGQNWVIRLIFKHSFLPDLVPWLPGWVLTSPQSLSSCPGIGWLALRWCSADNTTLSPPSLASLPALLSPVPSSAPFWLLG